MSASNTKAIEAGHVAAESPSVKLWGVFGFFLPLLGILVAYIRSPTMPTAALVAYDDDDTRVFYQSGFAERLKERQVRAAWIGFGVSFLCVMLVGMAMCTLTVAGLSELSENSTFGDVIQGAVESQRIVTADEFAQIRDGMTYAQVRAIVGAVGEEQSRTTLGGITTVMYAWTNADFSIMAAMFQDNKLVSKSQVGL